MVQSTQSAPPAWWTGGNPPVINSNLPNNNGPANIGQAKHVARSAIDALRPDFPALADQIEADLTGGSNPILDFSVPNPKPPEWRNMQKAPLLIGQLKAIADPFYTRLHATAPAWLEAERIANGTQHPGSIFPWSSATIDDNNQGMANIGQLKAVFSLRFESLLSFDSDGDGMPDWWEVSNGLDPDDPADINADPEADGLSNHSEQSQGTNPMLMDHPAVQLNVVVGP